MNLDSSNKFNNTTSQCGQITPLCQSKTVSIVVGNDDYIISCNFVGSIMSGFAVTEGVGAVLAPEAKKASLIRVKCSQAGLSTVIRTTTLFGITFL